MTDKVLIDSNVWIYAFMKGDNSRISSATKLIEQTELIILSTHIINEVCNVLLRKIVYQIPQLTSKTSSWL